MISPLCKGPRRSPFRAPSPRPYSPRGRETAPGSVPRPLRGQARPNDIAPSFGAIPLSQRPPDRPIDPNMPRDGRPDRRHPLHIPNRPPTSPNRHKRHKLPRMIGRSGSRVVPMIGRQQHQILRRKQTDQPTQNEIERLQTLTKPNRIVPMPVPHVEILEVRPDKPRIASQRLPKHLCMLGVVLSPMNLSKPTPREQFRHHPDPKNVPHLIA